MDKGAAHNFKVANGLGETTGWAECPGGAQGACQFRALGSSFPSADWLAALEVCPCRSPARPEVPHLGPGPSGEVLTSVCLPGVQTNNPYVHYFMPERHI